MLRWILQVLVIGLVVYLGYFNRYRLLNVILSNGVIRQFLVSRSLNSSFIRNRVMGAVFNRS